VAVKRIVTNIAANQLDRAAAFYTDILGLKLGMDFGWIQTYAGDGSAAPQISIATEGGSGTPVPDLSIEVDNLDEVYQRVVEQGLTVEYGPENEPWGVCLHMFTEPDGSDYSTELEVTSLTAATPQMLPDMQLDLSRLL
jgi:catechol 2,3-dioxygenase-like lactoylglutathione lyase family enzyme